jgi:glycosyltransferase involved in cell wall biosynthesis
MSRKRPVIATDVMGNRELLKNGRGILIRPNSAELALQIDKIIANSDIQKTLTENAYEYIKDNHKLDEQIAKLTENYRTLLFSMERTGQIEIFADTKYRL